MSHMCSHDKLKMIPEPVVIESAVVYFVLKALGSARSAGIQEERRGGVVWETVCSLFTNGQSLEITS